MTQSNAVSVAARNAIEIIRETQGAKIVGLSLLANGDIALEVRADDLLAVATFLRDDPRLDCRYFNIMFGVDRGEHLETIYILNSLSRGLRLQLKVRLDASAPNVPSVTGIWAGANWHEREAYDLFGITFTGHPYHKRMFMEDDFEGHPMRKSFKLAGRAE